MCPTLVCESPNATLLVCRRINIDASKARLVPLHLIVVQAQVVSTARHVPASGEGEHGPCTDQSGLRIEVDIAI